MPKNTLPGFPDVDIPEAAMRFPHTVQSLANEIYQGLGAASTCWDNIGAAGTFDSTHCKEIGDKLFAFILEKTGLGEPNLGCATTEELVQELHTRIAIGLGGGDKDYRTIDSE